MKALSTAILILVLSPIGMVILSGVYFGLTLWLTGGFDQFGELGEFVGRVSFVVGVPAGAVMAVAVLARIEKKQKSRALEWIGLVVSFGLAAILFFVPLCFGFGQIALLFERPFGVYIGMAFVLLVGWLVRQIDDGARKS